MAYPKIIDKEKATQLWNDGLLDTEIAKYFGCTHESVYNWRKRNGLPSNYFGWVEVEECSTRTTSPLKSMR